MKITRTIAFAASLCLILAIDALPQTPVFNYQGRLTDGGNPANGSFQMQFKLFDSLGGPGQVGATLTDVPVTVTQGIFSARLDFGADALTGANRWLEIAVRQNAGEAYTTLTPREQIASSRYAVRALSAASPDNEAQLGGVNASQSPTNASPGARVIRNQTTLQSQANFNISGNGFVGGNVGIGTTNPTSKLEIAAQNGLSITGYHPYMTLRDTNSNGLRSILASGNGDFGFYPDSFIGSVPAVVIKNSSGNVGIGTSTPSAGKLQVATSSKSAVYATTSDWRHSAVFAHHFAKAGRGIGLTASTSSPDGYSAVFGGRVSIDPSVVGDPRQPLLHVAGPARIASIPLDAWAGHVCFNAAGDLLNCNFSSLSAKNNVHDFRSGLDVVRRLRPINFNWKENGLPGVGLGAEDVAEVAPSLVETNDKGEVSGVKYERLNMVLINAIKEQQEQLERQQRQIDAMNRQLCSRWPRSKGCRRQR